MKTIYTLIIAASLLLSSILVCAAPVSLSDAQKTATKFYLQQKSSIGDATINSSKVYRSGNTDIIAVFAFNTGGFVAMSLDDRFNPVLAYSLTGYHNPCNFSNQTTKWFSDLAILFQEVITSSSMESIVHADWERIESGNFPILSTKAELLATPEWGQGCYYNTACPSDAMGTCGHTATGCTATAMAMIMKYWNYPQYGIGSHSYETSWYGTQTANFGETEYLWGDMPAAQPTEENPALATLMFHCGVAVDMEYGAGTSGAYPSPASFADYFGYSQNARYEYLTDYTLPEWVEILKNEIDNGRPVLYAGWESMLIMGHSWVCDGYDESDYLHFNWGDNGSGNGYFLLPEITFPANNMIVRNIFPASNCDVKTTQITAPFAHTFIGPASIKVLVENYSNQTLTDIPISYSVNGSIPVTDTIEESIEPNGTYIFEFTQAFDFSQNPGTLYHVKVYTDLACETYRENDTTETDILNVSCASIPYNTDFVSGENTDGWLFEDSNSDGRGWLFSYVGDASVFYEGSSQAANDWLFSRCLELEAGKLYKLTFDYKSTGDYWPQNLEILIGTGPESMEMIESLDEITGFINDVFLQKEVLFTVMADGSYYLGFHCFSNPDMLNLLIDNVNIVEMSNTDVELSQIVSPQTSCELGTEEVVIVLRNLCSEIIEQLTISYVVDGGEPITQLAYPIISPGEFIDYAFEVPADLSDSGSHNLEVYVSLLGDNNQTNDTLEIIVENRDASYAPYLCEFETTAEYEFYSIENLNDDSHTWQYISTGGHTNPGCVRYDYNDFNPANDWLITKCIYFDHYYAYRLSFWNKIEDPTWPENLKVAISDVQNSASMFPILADYPGLENTNWQQNTINFSVTNDGFYYIGFHCYSATQMFNLYLDDIEITEDGINNISRENGNNFYVFPNPTNDILSLHFNDNSVSQVKITIYDLQGKTLVETTLNNDSNSVNIESLESGIYMISIEGDNLKEIQRFVKL